MKITVIGTGWLGHDLAEHLVTLGHEVIGTNRSGISVRNCSYQLVKWDPTSDTNQSITTTDTDWLILCFPPDRTKTDQYATHCIRATSCISSKVKVLLISSTSVYPNLPLTFSEDYPVMYQNELNPIAKGEELLYEKLGVRLTIIRMSGLIGYDRWPIKSILKAGKTINGYEPVNMIFKEDAIGLIVHIINTAAHISIINACAPEHCSKQQVYSKMASLLKLPKPIFHSSGIQRIIHSNLSQNIGYNYIKPSIIKELNRLMNTQDVQ